MSAEELQAARAERAARYAAAQASSAAPADVSSADAATRKRSAAAAVLVSTQQRVSTQISAPVAPGVPVAPRRLPPGGGPDPLVGIVLSGVDDCPTEVTQGLRKGQFVEVDCRLWESGWKPINTGGSSRVFTLQRGEGALHDKKAETSAEQERNIRHLTESARRIHAARSRGERVWVHCHMGKNRGPAGLFAYLILHTNVPSLDEAFQMVKRHDTRNPRVVATSRNTFLEELKIMCAKVGKPANLPS